MSNRPQTRLERRSLVSGISRETKTMTLYSVELDSDEIETIVERWFMEQISHAFADVKDEAPTMVWGSGQMPSLSIRLTVEKED